MQMGCGELEALLDASAGARFPTAVRSHATQVAKCRRLYDAIVQIVLGKGGDVDTASRTAAEAARRCAAAAGISYREIFQR